MCDGPQGSGCPTRGGAPGLDERVYSFSQFICLLVHGNANSCKSSGPASGRPVTLELSGSEEGVVRMEAGLF